MLKLTNHAGGPGPASSSLDVTLTNTGTSLGDDVTISGFSFEITAAGGDVTFSMVSTATEAATYVFGADGIFGPDITLGVSPDGHTISASDNYGPPNSGVTLGHGQTLGLGHVLYTLSANAPSSPITLTFTPFPDNQHQRPRPGLAPLDVVLPSGGDSTIDGNVSVAPEPGTLIMGLQAVLLTGYFARRLRSRPRAAP